MATHGGTLQRKNAENLKQIFPEKEYRGLSPNFQIHVSVSELYIPTMERYIKGIAFAFFMLTISRMALPCNAEYVGDGIALILSQRRMNSR
jgi:hypothetical protein